MCVCSMLQSRSFQAIHRSSSLPGGLHFYFSHQALFVVLDLGVQSSLCLLSFVSERSLSSTAETCFRLKALWRTRVKMADSALYFQLVALTASVIGCAELPDFNQLTNASIE